MASFKKLGTDNWQVSFYAKNYLGKNKKYKKSGFRTKAKANEYATDFIAKMSGSSDVMLFTVFDEFVEYMKDKVKATTHIGYKYTRNTLHRITDDMPLNKITEKHLFIILEKLNHIPSRKKKVKAILSQIFEYSMIHYSIKNNPVKNLKLTKTLKEKETPKQKIWTIEDFNQFIADITLNTPIKKLLPRYILGYNILYFTGMRVGEMSALTKEDFDFERGVIKITKTRMFNHLILPPKTKCSIREVLMHKALYDMAKEYLDSIPDIKGEFIFPGVNSITHTFMWTHLDFTSAPKINLHGFRHSHASFLISQGVDITTISRRLGHSSPYITLKVYAHFYKKDNDEIVEVLNKL